MKQTDFSRILPCFFERYLPNEINASENTVLSYCDTIRLLLTYCRDKRGMKVEKIKLSDFSAGLIKDFLSWIQNERGCGVSTKNQRLAAIHSLFRFAQTESPQNISVCQSILAIEFGKEGKKLVNYLETDEMIRILEQPNKNNLHGRRDLCFVSLLYDSGARVSEIIKMKVRDVRLENPAKATLLGKGNKLREVPLLATTAANLRQYMTEQRLNTSDKLDHPLFFNRQRKCLTRTGASYILNKYVAAADVDKRVTPHVLRHSKAMHLLEGGTNIFYIKGLLGHEDVVTTEVYAKANIEMQRKAFEKHANTDILPLLPENETVDLDGDTIEWLKSFRKS